MADEKEVCRDALGNELKVGDKVAWGGVVDKVIVKPTIEQALAVWREEDGTEDFEHIEDETYGTWRHGSCHAFVFKRKSDVTYWQVCYRSNPGGDYNDFRDGDLSDGDVVRVVPVERLVRSWEAPK